MDKRQSLMNLFPANFRKKMEAVGDYVDVIEEIRIRANMPVCLYIEGREYFIEEQGKLTFDRKEAYTPGVGQVEEVFKHICDYSPYAFADELRNGFMTVTGGHRVGVAGQVMTEGEQVIGMKNIRFLNIRIAHEIMGAADLVIPQLIKDGKFLSTLIISAPGCGKTTLLRDLIRQLSDGNDLTCGMTVGVVDERSEIAGCYMGVPQNKIGFRTDVLDGCPKTRGMMMLIRSMKPDVVAIDELGGNDDIVALNKVIYCGSRVLVTIHGESMEEIARKRELKTLMEEQVFERFVILTRKEDKRCFEILDKGGKFLCCV